jgi:hypothetical protein
MSKPTAAGGAREVPSEVLSEREHNVDAKLRERVMAQDAMIQLKLEENRALIKDLSNLRAEAQRRRESETRSAEEAYRSPQQS